MMAKSNIISFRAYAKQTPRMTSASTRLDQNERHWDMEDLKRILFTDAGPLEPSAHMRHSKCG